MLSVFSEAMRNGVDPSVCLLLFKLTLLCFKISSVACLFPNHNERYNGVLPFISIVFMSAFGHCHSPFIALGSLFMTALSKTSLALRQHVCLLFRSVFLMDETLV